MPRGSLPPVGNLPDSWGPIGPMNRGNWRTTVLTLTICLPLTFGWLVGDAEWVMGMVRGEAGSDPRGHVWVTWGVYLCAGKLPLADIILSHPPDLT